MRVLATVAMIGCLVPAGLGFGPPSLIESSQAAAPLYAQQVPAIQRFQAPAFAPASGVIVDGRTGEVLYAKAQDERRAMASLTKMMTALVALERGDLEARVRVDIDAAALVDSSVMGLRPGEELSLLDLLYGLLLPSGNDAALAIAEHVGGSVGGFAELMNRRAVELGMVNSRFVNPHGLDDPDHYSSAADLVLLARAAMANPVFARIVSTPERTVRGKLATYVLRNTNRLLGQYPGVDGIKTGSTDVAGQCLVSTALRGENRVYTVVLGSSERFTDTIVLLDYYFSGFTCGSLELESVPFATLPAGEVLKEDSTAEPVLASPVVASNQEKRSDLRLDDELWGCFPAWQGRWLRAEVEWTADQTVGTLRYYVGERLLAKGRVSRQ